MGNSDGHFVQTLHFPELGSQPGTLYVYVMLQTAVEVDIRAEQERDILLLEQVVTCF